MADDTKAKVAAGVGAFGTTAAIGAAMSGSSVAAMTSTLATLGLVVWRLVSVLWQRLL